VLIVRWWYWLLLGALSAVIGFGLILLGYGLAAVHFPDVVNSLIALVGAGLMIYVAPLLGVVGIAAGLVLLWRRSRSN
jgi:hypothetical protein